jgi:hypothetical protein
VHVSPAHVIVQTYLDIPRLTIMTISLKADAALYLEYERELYMLRNGDWERSRDRLADAVFHALLEEFAQLQSRSYPFNVEYVLDRIWFPLVPLAALQTATYSEGTFVVEIASVAMMGELMGAMDEECVRQAGAAGDVYVLQKKPGRRSRMRDSIFFHIRMPAYLHYAPGNDTGDVSTIRCHAAKVHRGHTVWATWS